MHTGLVHEELNKSITELHQKLDGQNELLSRLMELQAKIDNGSQNSFPGNPRREQRLMQALHEAVAVLEESRRSFRSRQLENLRKRLTQVLLEADLKESDGQQVTGGR
ncbi:hypothetical protein [Desulfonatronum parangueonense]